MSPERRSQAAANDLAPETSTSTTKFVIDSTAGVGEIRCRCCRRALTAEASIRYELGPVCRRLVAPVVGVA